MVLARPPGDFLPYQAKPLSKKHKSWQAMALTCQAIDRNRAHRPNRCTRSLSQQKHDLYANSKAVYLRHPPTDALMS